MKISVCGAAAVWDRVFSVERLPVVGETVTITDRSNGILPGGCAPNIAMRLAKLTRASVELRYPVGNDFSEFGLEGVWQSHGIDCSHLTHVADQPSGGAYLFMQPDGKTMCFSDPSASATAVPEGTDALGDIVVVSPLLNDFTKALLQAAIRERKQIVFTGIGTPEVLSYLDCIDVLIVNATESSALLAAGGFGSPEELLGSHPELIGFITSGGEGSCVYSGSQSVCIPPVQCERFVDATGAGDAYTAGVIAAMTLGLDLRQTAYLAAVCASFAVEAWGGQAACADLAQCMQRLGEQHPTIASAIRQRLSGGALPEIAG